jgi:hypothetical protein
MAVIDQHLVFSGGDVPYADDGFVGRVPKAGGPIQWLALLLTETSFVPLAGPTPSFFLLLEVVFLLLEWCGAPKRVNANFAFCQNIPC